MGLDGEYGFAPSNYIEITGKAEQRSPQAALSPQTSEREIEPEQPSSPVSPTRSGPAAAMAGIMHPQSSSADLPPANISLPSRKPQFTPEHSDEEPPAPSLPQRPPSQQLSPAPAQHTSPRTPDSPGIAASPPFNRAVSRNYDEDQPQVNSGGFHLYNINEMVSAMGKNKKLPTTLGLNLATGVIMIAPEKSRDGPQQEWTAEKLTHYSIEGKHVFVELVRPSKSVDFHAGAKDTAQEITRGLGEIAGAARAEGLREVLEASAGSGGGQKKGHVLYDFMAQGEDEVTVAVGDEVIVVDDTKSEEWWMVRRLKNGKEGVVPSTYVEVTGVVAPPRTSSGVNAGKSIVEQNRLEEEKMVKEAVKVSKTEAKAAERSKKESKHGRSSSASKSKPDMAKTRTWTDRSGTFKVEAQFIGLKEGKIHLHKLNGVKIAVPVVKMAIEDLEYVEKVTGVSLDDDKPLSDIKRRSTQTAKSNDRKKSESAASGAKAGATVEPSKPKPDGPEYDWFDFFLKAGVSPYQCERYAFNFKKDSMDENVLGEITPSVLRTLGLKEGDILRVMKYLDTKFSRTGMSSLWSSTSYTVATKLTFKGGQAPEGEGGGLFSGPGGALRNNTRKGRPAPTVQSSDVVNANTFRQRENEIEKAKLRAEAVPTPSETAPPPPKKDTRGFDDDAWDVKPSKTPTQQSSQPSVAASVPATSAPPQQPTLTGSLLDLSLLSPPLQPTPAPTAPTAPTQKPLQPLQPQSTQNQPPAQVPPPQPMQQQPTGANPQFFSQLGQQPTGLQSQQQNTTQMQQPQGFGFQQSFQNQQPQQTGPPRQRPQAPQISQQGSIMPPPPARPLSAPQTQPQNSSFGPPPLQPQLTGFQPQSQFGNHMAAPGQSLNDLNQQRMQQQQFNQQQQQQHQQLGQQLGHQQFGQQQLQPQQTGFGQQNPGFNQFGNGMMPQQTAIGQQYQMVPRPSELQGMQNPYINGQQTGSPFADPRGQLQTGGFQPLQAQNTGYQAQFQPSLQPQQTGINSMLPPALQPQQTGVNGISRPGFAQTPPPMPPMPSMPSQPAAAPLLPQKTGPAPPVRFGTPAANKLVPQRTGRANLASASECIMSSSWCIMN